jgi:hypothetical protein
MQDLLGEMKKGTQRYVECTTSISLNRVAIESYLDKSLGPTATQPQPWH